MNKRRLDTLIELAADYAAAPSKGTRMEISEWIESESDLDAIVEQDASLARAVEKLRSKLYGSTR